MGPSPSETGWVHHGVTGSAHKPTPRWAPQSTGPPCQEPAPVWASPQGHSLFWASVCSSVGCAGAAGGCLLRHGPPRTARAQLLHHGLQGIFLSTWSTFSLSFTDLLVTQSCLTRSSFLILWPQLLPCNKFFPLNMLSWSHY